MYQNINLTINRIFWKYTDTNNHRRPNPFKGVLPRSSKYKICGPSLKEDMDNLALLFIKKYPIKDYKYVIALSGGIDSELTAETLYKLNIPFKAITLRFFFPLITHSNNCNLSSSIFIPLIYTNTPSH